VKPITQGVLIIQLFGPNTIKIKEGKQLEPKWQPAPKIQMVEYSQPVGPMKSEEKLTEQGLYICCGAHDMSYYTKREEVQQLPSSPT
jgi:hypothetical protein